MRSSAGSRQIETWAPAVRITFSIFLLCAAASAQQFTTLANFSFDNQTGGYSPNGMIQGFDGNFYGTVQGNFIGCGTFFKIGPTFPLTETNLDCINGGPASQLLQATDGSFYDAARNVIFKISPSGDATTLYTFCLQTGCPDGSFLEGSLVQGTDGNFYGTTDFGGAHSSSDWACLNGCGTVFKITPEGILTTLYSFCAVANCGDGVEPAGGLIQAADGNFYGLTYNAGHAILGGGTAFRLTPAGKLTTLYRFCSLGLRCRDGAFPLGPLIQVPNGNFYGTTLGGGIPGRGTIFELTPSGKLTTLYTFCQHESVCIDGANPQVGLVLATDGNFYGSTQSGGKRGAGTLFKITADGVLTTLHSFCNGRNCPDGAVPSVLIQGTDGNFYGATHGGGNDSAGTIFRLDAGLGPFVKTSPLSGKAGSDVRILGTNLTYATDVSFNGIPAAFSVVADSQIRATVPLGATTGKITVRTPSGTLTSNFAFHVEQ